MDAGEHNVMPMKKGSLSVLFIDDHQYLIKVLQRLKENQLTVNVPKCLIRVPEYAIFGHVFSGGVSPDPKKVEALRSVNEV